jgi:aminobenzoyl-glutamate utilization protein A
MVAVANVRPGVAEVIRTQTLAGSGDANLLIRHVQGRGGQGAYIMIGASSPGPHHSATFDLAEDAIAIGIDTLEALIRSN